MLRCPCCLPALRCCVINQNYATKRATRMPKGLICAPYKMLKRCPVWDSTTREQQLVHLDRRQPQNQQRERQREREGRESCPSCPFGTALFFHCCTFTVINFNTHRHTHTHSCTLARSLAAHKTGHMLLIFGTNMLTAR